jgi:hypothetical protein
MKFLNSANKTLLAAHLVLLGVCLSGNALAETAPVTTDAAPAAAQPQPPRTTLSTGQLRPTASSLALVQPPASKQGPIEAAPLRRLADETLVRQDADYLIRLTNGDETRLMVSDPQGRVVFNAAIDTPEGRSRMPVSVRDRVDEMERMLERHDQPSGIAATAAAPKAAPQVEVGRLDVSPVELR